MRRFSQKPTVLLLKWLKERRSSVRPPIVNYTCWQRQSCAQTTNKRVKFRMLSLKNFDLQFKNLNRPAGPR